MHAHHSARRNAPNFIWPPGTGGMAQPQLGIRTADDDGPYLAK